MALASTDAPALHPPGTALLRTLEGHRRSPWVAVTPDGGGGLRVRRLDAEGVGSGERARAAHPHRPRQLCLWRGGDARRAAGRLGL